MSLSAIGRSRKANLLELKTRYSPPVNFASRVVVASLYSLPPRFSQASLGFPFTWKSRRTARRTGNPEIARKCSPIRLAFARGGGFVGAFGRSCRPQS